MNKIYGSKTTIIVTIEYLSILFLEKKTKERGKIDQNHKCE